MGRLYFGQPPGVQTHREKPEPAPSTPLRTAAVRRMHSVHSRPSAADLSTCQHVQASPERDWWLERHWAEVAQIEQALEKAAPGSLEMIEAVREENAQGSGVRVLRV